MADQQEDTNDGEDVKSNSLMVKFESTSQELFSSSTPKLFSTLPAAVDLKRPPSNWLNGQIKLTPSSVMTSSSNLSSFKMAFDFWRELGNVDVISDSENIKNLLKIPYSDNNVLSYFVHRVGNTLLIDDFDLQKYFLWKSEEDWKWLRSFIYENVMSQTKDRKPVPIQHKTREYLEQKHLLSKFLYHSIGDSKKIEEKEYVPKNFSQPLLPQPKREDISDNQNHQFSRNVLWTFEDIRMLIGSDMQIFGNQSRPCISLRLRDMKKPINVLTGIDYWLDNLMCNVPEIFLCFHQNGIVQKYELIKTEDLPSLENSKFSPKVIRNVAQNILSFLKANATKSGHTYWLFKAKNDDVVKLYDLTTLQLLATTKDDENENTESESSDKKEENDQNPFTIPVAMLLYTVARNMKYSNEKLSAKQAGNIKQLLDNCLKLLPKDKYPQIVTSSHYILSDIQIQAGMDPANPSVPFNDEDDSDSDEFFDEQISDDELDIKEGEEYYSAIQSISDAIKESKGGKSKMSRPAPLSLGSVKERSELALENIISGLSCLQFFQSESSMAQEKQKEKERIIHEEQNPSLANPEVPIPLGWSQKDEDGSKKSKKNHKKCEASVEAAETSNEVQLDSRSLLMKGAPNVKTWNTHLKVLLFEKASLAYACLAEDSYAEKNFGKALRHLEMSIMCQSLVTKYVPGMATQRCCLFGRAGDCYFQISKALDKAGKFIDGYKNSESDLDKKILKELEKENLVKDALSKISGKEEEMLEASCKCYEASLPDTKESKFELARRLGNVYNETGVFFMHMSQQLYNSQMSQEDLKQLKSEEASYQQMAKKSYDYLMKAVTLFENVNDSVNLIICNLNLGRFFRLSAHINIFHEIQTAKTLQMQKKMYQESFNSYHRALAIIENRKSNPELWDMVTWELSTATFNLAKQMQDFSTNEGNADKLERDVLEMLMKALKLCDLETSCARQVLYCFRAGLIHHRLGSFYHQTLRTASDDAKKRTTLQLCRLNYEKSSNLLESLKEFKDFFQVQMERVALQELLAEESSTVQQKAKNYQIALNHFYETSKMLGQLLHAKTVMDIQEISTLLELFEKRLQHILKTLAKLAMSGKKVDPKGDVYKKMFACTLRVAQKHEIKELVNHLLSVLEKVQKCDAN